uniref:Putative secreted peptide n=1 Tax=Anopheles braziliensis TaxID=58242 RepID=A0A2M3ZPG7_9DIPT
MHHCTSWSECRLLGSALVVIPRVLASCLMTTAATSRPPTMLNLPSTLCVWALLMFSEMIGTSEAHSEYILRENSALFGH